MKPREENTAIGRAAGKIGAATFLSHVFGMVRDILFAALFGTSLYADAFNLSFSLPSFLRRVFGEGVMNAAFVPVFSQFRLRRGEKDASRLASNAFFTLALFLILSIAIAVLFAPWLVDLFARGWRGDPERMAVAVRLTRLLFPYVFFVGLAVLVMGMLNAVRHFTLPALSPVIFNLGMIGAALLAFRLPPEGTSRIDLFCGGVIAGSFGQLLIQLPMLRRKGIRIRPVFHPADPEIRAIGALMIPGVLGIAVIQINLLVDTVFATFLPEGSVTALRFGNRVMLLPLAIFATAVASASLPSLSTQVAEGGADRAKGTLAYSLRFLFFFLLPAAAGLMVLCRPVIRLIFVRGAFDGGRSLDLTASTLLLYCVGLFAYGGIKGVAQVFFSLRDTRTPVVVGAVAMVANVIFNLMFNVLSRREGSHWRQALPGF